MTQNRIEWIDLAKGIGMLLVMFGHVPIPQDLSKFIYTFHVPLFFFLSGLLFSISKYPSFKTFLNKKFFSLIIPYFGLSIILTIWFFVIGFVGNPDPIGLPTRIIGIVLSIRNVFGTGTLWFISCLFITELIFYIILRRYQHSLVKIIASSAFLSIIGVGIVAFYNKPLVWNIDAALVVIIFFGLGYSIKNIDGLLNKITRPYLLPLYFLLTFVVGMSNNNIDLFSNQYGNYVLFYIAAFSGIGLVLTISKLINKNLILQFVGMNTLLLLLLHTMIFNLLQYLIPFAADLPFIKSALMGCVFVSITVLISTIFVKITNKYLPILVGKNNQINKSVIQKELSQKV
ncbi:acyltransferase family protein [Paenibacillus sp. L3-i20]|uniref:acyltransferase family protein n=1 Tax=Paenibacillus sp. L3-i20 TaxID=2905833 RepID=UPI001EE11E3A|nr:acyltransferase family protein [Paenibacillus sp. L3-i20]